MKRLCHCGNDTDLDHPDGIGFDLCEKHMNEDKFEYRDKHGFVKYCGRIIEKCDVSACVRVFEITRWSDKNTYSVTDEEVVLEGVIKWDGCSHINFGDSDRYIHLCGKTCWIEFAEMLPKLYEWTVKHIEKYDVKCAEG